MNPDNSETLSTADQQSSTESLQQEPKPFPPENGKPTDAVPGYPPFTEKVIGINPANPLSETPPADIPISKPDLPVKAIAKSMFVTSTSLMFLSIALVLIKRQMNDLEYRVRAQENAVTDMSDMIDQHLKVTSIRGSGS